MTTDGDPFQSQEWLEFAESAMNELYPKLSGSSVTVSLVPRGPTDIKFALETGMSIMLDKPIILVVSPGAKVPDKLRRVADAIIEADDMSDPGFHTRLSQAIERIVPE